MAEYVIGVDIGSGSTRAGIFNLEGKMIGLGVQPIEIRRPEPDYAEQSSEEIWEKTCIAVKTALKESKVDPKDIKGISFDATCSLVALGEKDTPVSVAKDNNSAWNIIMWMDHRAQKEADEINSKDHEVLKYVGGKISVEMEIPKIMWLKRNLPNQYSKVTQFFDLADFMQYKACGSKIRSSCTVTCKWTYLAHNQTWSSDFFSRCGIEEILDGRIGTTVDVPGKTAGFITQQTAEAMGLTTGCQCMIGMIDAHAGGVGCVGEDNDGALAIIAGTSACHMLNTKNPIFVPGVWGPYYGAMVDGLWLSEGGQSAAGSLIDYTIQSHAYYPSLKKEADKEGKSVHECLNIEIESLKKKYKFLNENLHILGYHHGNRSPRADFSLRGMISGLTLDMGKESLALMYLAAIQSTCYGTRHIIEECINAGHTIKRIIVCGGATKNPLWLQEMADITGYDIEIPRESEAVLLGSAILAASDIFGGTSKAAKAMCHSQKSIKPNKSLSDFHSKKYSVFLKMYHDQIAYRSLMV